MNNLILNIFKLFSFEKKSKLYLMYFFVLLLTLLEALGIALILPAIVIITQGKQDSNFFLFFEQLGSYFNFNNIILLFLIVFLLVYISKFLLSLFCIYFQYNFAFNFYKNISEKIYKSYLGKNFLEHINLRSSDLIRKISSDIDQATSNSVLPLFTLITELSIMFGIFFFLLYLNVKLTLFVFLVTFGLIILYFYIAKRPTDYWARIKIESETSKISLMQQSFLTINEIKILSAENLMKKKFDELNKKQAKAFKFQAILIDSNKFFVELAGVIMFVSLIYLFNNKIGNNFIGLISVYAASAFRFLPSINRLIVSAQKIRYAGPSVNKINEEIENLKSKHHIEVPDLKSNHIIFERNLELKNIYFQFPNGKEIMKNLNLKIQKKDKIGIKGPSGAGKSTLLYLISGLIPPKEGQILVDSKETNLNNSNWYKNIGYAPQFINLINDSIKENIIYGLDTKSMNEIDKKISEISKICLVDNFTDNTPEGLNTIVGENGLKVSGGQKQRIGIARTMFRNPEILILDEATSSLDPKTEEDLLSNILSFGIEKTVIISSHKESTLNHCNKIFNFENYRLEQIK